MAEEGEPTPPFRHPSKEGIVHPCFSVPSAGGDRSSMFFSPLLRRGSFIHVFQSPPQEGWPKAGVGSKRLILSHEFKKSPTDSTEDPKKEQFVEWRSTLFVSVRFPMSGKMGNKSSKGWSPGFIRGQSSSFLRLFSDVRFQNDFFSAIWTAKRAEIGRLTAKEFLPPALLEEPPRGSEGS